MHINSPKHSKSPFNLICLFFLIFTVPLTTFANTADWGMVQRFTKQLELAEQGNVKAMYDVGKLYERGRGVDKNMVKAAGWFQKATDGGHAAAQARLGIMYFEGRGVSKDHKKAINLILAAANKDIASAQFQLASMYELGAAVPKSLPKAISWYKKADHNGYYLAKSKVKYLQQVVAASRDTKKREVKKVETKIVKETLAPLMTAIMNGQWLKRENAVGYLPSNITTCARRTSDSLNCISTSQERDTGAEIVTYNTESTVLAKNRTDFQIIYDNNVLEVSTYAAENGEGVNGGVAPTRIKMGNQGKKHKLDCKLKNKNLISCSKGSRSPYELVSP